VAVAVLGELNVPTNTVHPHCDMADAAPRVEEAVEGVERAVVRCDAQCDEAEGCAEEPTAFVEQRRRATA